MNLKHDKIDIIAAGQQLFRASGYHATGVQQVLAACKISKGTFYNYFKSKEDFSIQVIQFYGEYMTNYITNSLIKESPSPINRLKEMYASLIVAANEEECAKGCLVYNFSYEVAGQNKAIANALDKQFNDWLDVIEKCIDAAKQAGEITSKKTARELAELIHASFNGAFGRVKMSRSTKEMENSMHILFELITS